MNIYLCTSMHIKTIINILNYTRGKSEVQFKMQYVFTRDFALRKKFGNSNGVNAKKKRQMFFKDFFERMVFKKNLAFCLL